ncbi:MAG TPA: hypothetical protein GXZ47_02445 [Treponema sp.]|nr:hypothetical protein [Treponema sp.]
MNNLISLYFAIGVCVVVSLIFLLFGLRIGSRVGRLRAEKGFDRRVRDERQDAVKRSRAVLGGLCSEQIAAFLPGFPADPTEVRFVGKPIDFISFTGSSRGEVTDITFIEVKSGESKLSPVEKTVRDAIKAGRVHYAEYRIPQK